MAGHFPPEEARVFVDNMKNAWVINTEERRVIVAALETRKNALLTVSFAADLEDLEERVRCVKETEALLERFKRKT